MNQKKKIAFGIDVGKKELVVCGRSSDGLTDFSAVFPNNSIGFKKLLVHIRDETTNHNIPILLESTGPYHWNAARYIAQSDMQARVVNPLFTKQMFRFSIRKRKTDKVDAGHLAFMASQKAGCLFKETEEIARKKALVRHYWKLKNSFVNHLRHERYLAKHRSISSFRISPKIDKEYKNLKEEIIKQFGKRNDVKYLVSIPGISPLLACTILAELAPIDRFTHASQLIAFAGLDPSVKQSGEKSYSKLSNRGSAILRETLFLAAFRAFSHYPFRSVYDYHKAKGLHHTAVMCILARKLLKISWTLLRKRAVFNEQHITNNLNSLDKT